MGSLFPVSIDCETILSTHARSKMEKDVIDDVLLSPDIDTFAIPILSPCIHISAENVSNFFTFLGTKHQSW